MSRATCQEIDCEWETDAPTIRAARALLARHQGEAHNWVEF